MVYGADAVDTPVGRVIGLRAPTIGGMVATVRIGQLEDGTPVVLKWAGPHLDSPGDLAAEALVLEHLAGTGLPTAQVLHAEPGMTITSWLPGRIDLISSTPSHLDAVAEQLVRLHRHPTEGAPVPEFASWAEPDAVPPEWGDHALWAEAIALSAEPVPVTADLVLCHRDFHPGNLLLTGATVTGIVDWGSACLGAPDVDVAHLVSNLACLHGVEAAIGFIDVHRRHAGRLQGQPHWWAYEVVSWLPEPAHILPPWQHARPDLTAGLVRMRCEELLRWALRGGPAGS